MDFPKGREFDLEHDDAGRQKASRSRPPDPEKGAVLRGSVPQERSRGSGTRVHPGGAAMSELENLEAAAAAAFEAKIKATDKRCRCGKATERFCSPRGKIVSFYFQRHCE